MQKRFKPKPLRWLFKSRDLISLYWSVRCWHSARNAWKRGLQLYQNCISFHCWESQQSSFVQQRSSIDISEHIFSLQVCENYSNSFRYEQKMVQNMYIVKWSFAHFEKMTGVHFRTIVSMVFGQWQTLLGAQMHHLEGPQGFYVFQKALHDHFHILGKLFLKFQNS